MFIEFIKGELYHGFALQLPDTYVSTMTKLEKLIEDHRELQDTFEETSMLQQAVPTVGRFHTPLPLAEAWSRYDLKYSVSGRRHGEPPN